MLKMIYIFWLKWAKGCCRHWCFTCAFYNECHYGNLLEELKIQDACNRAKKEKKHEDRVNRTRKF